MQGPSLRTDTEGQFPFSLETLIRPKVTGRLGGMLQSYSTDDTETEPRAVVETLRVSLLAFQFPDSCGPPPSVMTAQHYLRFIAIHLSR